MRRIVQGVYWTLTIGLGASIAGSATYGAFARPNSNASELVSLGVTPSSDEGRQCAAALKTLYDELVERAGRTLVGDGGPSPEMIKDWSAWAANWHQRLAERRASCRLGEAASMESTNRLARQLERLELAYTTSVRSFSDVGRKQLLEARDAFERLGLNGPASRP